MLKQRGTAIKHTKYDEVKKIDLSITKEVSENYKTYTEPVSAFITFSSKAQMLAAIDYTELVNQRE